MATQGKRILVIGATGYIGGHLIQKLIQDKNNKVFGLSYPGEINATGWHAFEGDLLNPNLKNLLEHIQPDEIYHAAGISRHAPLSNQLTFHAEGTRHLLTAIYEARLKTKTLILSSAAEYGPNDNPVDENTLPQPQHRYGIAKLAQTNVALMLAKQYNLPVVVARLFNVYGQSSEDFVTGAISKQFIAAIEKDIEKPIITTMNLKSHRDFIHIEDAIEAFTALMNSGQSEEIYNVASGKATNIQSLIAKIARQTGFTDYDVNPEGKQYRDFSQAMIDKITEHTNWQPQISLKQGLKRELKDVKNPHTVKAVHAKQVVPLNT